MKVTAEGIEDGTIPIAAGGSDAAWDPDNPYKNLDNANKVAPPEGPKVKPDPETLSPA
jgi:hypothetical protein